MPDTHDHPPQEEGAVLSDVELATNWLLRELNTTEEALRMNALSTNFTLHYNPKPVPKPAGIEPGNSDYSDWQIAQGEYSQWPQEREENLERLDTEEQALSDKLSDLLEDQSQLGEQNPLVITRLATLERERIAANARRAKKDQEKKLGVHFEGIEEVVKLIAQLKAAEKSGRIKTGTVLNGWTHVFTSQEGYAYHFQEGTGPLGGYLASIAIGKDPFDSNPRLINVRFTNLQGVQAQRIDYGTRVEGEGTWLHMNIDKYLIKDHHASIVKPRLKFGGYGPIEPSHTGEELDVSQGLFDEFHSALQSLVDAAIETK